MNCLTNCLAGSSSVSVVKSFVKTSLTHLGPWLPMLFTKLSSSPTSRIKNPFSFSLIWIRSNACVALPLGIYDFPTSFASDQAEAFFNALWISLIFSLGKILSVVLLKVFSISFLMSAVKNSGRFCSISLLTIFQSF
jgi:hypothetical protein